MDVSYESYLKQYFSNFVVPLNPPRILLKCRFCFSRSGRGPRVCISTKISNDADVAGHTFSTKD